MVSVSKSPNQSTGPSHLIIASSNQSTPTILIHTAMLQCGTDSNAKRATVAPFVAREPLDRIWYLGKRI